MNKYSSHKCKTILRLAEVPGSLSNSSPAPEMIKFLGGKTHLQHVHIHGTSWGAESEWKKTGETWLAASSHFHFEQMRLKSLDRAPVDLDKSVYLLSFKESHRRTVMKSGAIVPFKAKKIYVCACIYLFIYLFILLEKTEG